MNTARCVGLTEQIIKTLTNQPSLFQIKELTIDGPKSPYIFNKIEQPLVNMPNMINLSITNHQIEKIENISFLTQLKMLSLKGNRIKIIERLESLKNLLILDLSDNLIERIPFQVLTRLSLLEDLNLSNNSICDNSEVKGLLSNKNL